MDHKQTLKSEAVNPEVASQIQKEIHLAIKNNIEQNNKSIMNSFVNLMKSQYYKSAIRVDKKKN